MGRPGGPYSECSLPPSSQRSQGRRDWPAVHSVLVAHCPLSPIVIPLESLRHTGVLINLTVSHWPGQGAESCVRTKTAVQ